MAKDRRRRRLGIRVDAIIERYGYYVYYLCCGDEIVYVGQTASVLGRMSGHMSGHKKKIFDSVMYRQCKSESEMYELEKREIERLRPKLNVRDNPDARIRLYCVLCGKYLNASFWSQGSDDKGGYVPLCWKCHEAWEPPLSLRPNGIHAQQYEQRVEAFQLLLRRGEEMEAAS